jgi:hypothetical protein
MSRDQLTLEKRLVNNKWYAQRAEANEEHQ